MGNPEVIEQRPKDSALIEVLPMPLSSEARGCQDDWTGCSNRAVRRKLQNKLNQRASRRRRGVTSSTPMPEASMVQEERNLDLNSTLSQLLQSNHRRLSNGLKSKVVNQSAMMHLAHQVQIGYLRHVQRRISQEGLEECMTRSYLSSIMDASSFITWIRTKTMKEPDFEIYKFVHPISSDHLLTLTLFNLVRGLTTNIIALGVDPALMHTDIPSPFASLSSSPNRALCLPPSLQPTLLQKTIPHHVEIDVLPFPRIRDNALMATDHYDEVELCMNMLGLDLPGSSMPTLDRKTDTAKTGILVWGEPSLQGNWEVSERFARKWLWLLRGSTEILKSTNYWRQQRGEQPLYLEL